MKPPEDIGKLILQTLSQQKDPIEIEKMAYLTGSTITQVTLEAKKLASFDLIDISENKLALRQGNRFNNWDRLKK